MKPGRIPCIVPYCRCTASQERHPGCTEVICAKHWRMVSRRTKARRRQADRRARKLMGLWEKPAYRAGLERNFHKWDRWYCLVGKAVRIQDEMWERCKVEAIERAAGI